MFIYNVINTYNNIHTGKYLTTIGDVFNALLFKIIYPTFCHFLNHYIISNCSLVYSFVLHTPPLCLLMLLQQVSKRFLQLLLHLFCCSVTVIAQQNLCHSVNQLEQSGKPNQTLSNHEFFHQIALHRTPVLCLASNSDYSYIVYSLCGFWF